MQILFLTSRFPYPPYRGDKLRAFNMIKALSRHHSIHLLSFIEKKSELRYLDILKEYCETVEVIYLPKWRSVLNCLCGIFSTKPFQVHYYSSSTMYKKFNSVLNQIRFDVVHLHLIRMAQYADIPNVMYPCLLDITDAVTLYLERYANNTKYLLIKYFVKWELKRIKRYQDILKIFDKCIVCSEIDQKYLVKSVSDAQIDVIYNSVDLDSFHEKIESQYFPLRIIYTGNMKYAPNTDGIQFFIHDIFPLIKFKIPEAQVYIVGQSPPRSVRSLSSENIIVTGVVEDIKAYYIKSAVAISPIRFGAGTLNKILEPMALGIPVVSTSIGFEGLDFQNGRDILIADDPKEFADAVVSVLRNKDLHDKLSENAKKIISEQYDSNKNVRKLEKIYKEIIKDKHFSKRKCDKWIG